MQNHLKMLNDLRVDLVRRRYDAGVINALTEIFEKWVREETALREGRKAGDGRG